MSDSEWSSMFLSALAAFAKSLGQSNLAIYSVDYNLEIFGSWTIELGRRHKRSLLQWDGKEFVLSLSRCNVSNSGAVKPWKHVIDEQLDSGLPKDELFQIAENLVLENESYR